MQNAGQYGPGAAGAHHPPPFVPSEPSPTGGSTTSSLRQFRKKDVEKPNLEKQVSEAHVARVAPHNHYPPAPNDCYRYQPHQFQEYGSQMKYPDLADGHHQQSSPISTSVIQKPKPKEYMEMCNPQQPHMKQVYPEHHLAGNQNYSPENAQFLHKEPPAQMHPGGYKPESQYYPKEAQQFHPMAAHHAAQKYNQMIPQNVRKYPLAENPFLSKLSKIQPTMARSIMTEHQLQDTQAAYSVDQRGAYQQSQRYYPGPIHSQVPYANHNQYQMNSPHAYPANYNSSCNYGRPSQMGSVSPASSRYVHMERSMSPTRRPYSENLSHLALNYQGIPQRMAAGYPQYNAPEYAQHYQHRRVHHQDFFQQHLRPAQYIPGHQMPTQDIPEIQESGVCPSESLKKFIENWGTEEDASDMGSLENTMSAKDRLREEPPAGTVYFVNPSDVPYFQNLVTSENAMPLIQEHCQYIIKNSVSIDNGVVRIIEANKEGVVDTNTQDRVVNLHIIDSAKPDCMLASNSTLCEKEPERKVVIHQNTIIQSGSNPLCREDFIERIPPISETIEAQAPVTESPLSTKELVDKNCSPINLDQLQDHVEDVPMDVLNDKLDQNKSPSGFKNMPIIDVFAEMETETKDASPSPTDVEEGNALPGAASAIPTEDERNISTAEETEESPEEVTDANSQDDQDKAINESDLRSEEELLSPSCDVPNCSQSESGAAEDVEPIHEEDEEGEDSIESKEEETTREEVSQESEEPTPDESDGAPPPKKRTGIFSIEDIMHNSGSNAISNRTTKEIENLYRLLRVRSFIQKEINFSSGEQGCEIYEKLLEIKLKKEKIEKELETELVDDAHKGSGMDDTDTEMDEATGSEGKERDVSRPPSCDAVIQETDSDVIADNSLANKDTTQVEENNVDLDKSNGDKESGTSEGDTNQAEEMCAKVRDSERISEKEAEPMEKIRSEVLEVTETQKDSGHVFAKPDDAGTRASTPSDVQYRSIIRIEESSVLVQIAGELMEINVNAVNGKKTITVVPLSESTVVDYNDNYEVSANIEAVDVVSEEPKSPLNRKQTQGAMQQLDKSSEMPERKANLVDSVVETRDQQELEALDENDAELDSHEEFESALDDETLIPLEPSNEVIVADPLDVVGLFDTTEDSKVEPPLKSEELDSLVDSSMEEIASAKFLEERENFKELLIDGHEDDPRRADATHQVSESVKSSDDSNVKPFFNVPPKRVYGSKTEVMILSPTSTNCEERHSSEEVKPRRYSSGNECSTPTLFTKAAMKLYDNDLQIPSVTTSGHVEKDNAVGEKESEPDAKASPQPQTKAAQNDGINVKRSKRINEKEQVKQEHEELSRKLAAKRKEKMPGRQSSAGGMKEDEGQDDEYADFKELLKARKLKRQRRKEEELKRRHEVDNNNGHEERDSSRCIGCEVSVKQLQTEKPKDSRNFRKFTDDVDEQPKEQVEEGQIVKEEKAARSEEPSPKVPQGTKKRVSFSDVVVPPTGIGDDVPKDPRHKPSIMVPSVSELIQENTTAAGAKRKISLQDYNNRKRKLMGTDDATKEKKVRIEPSRSLSVDSPSSVPEERFKRTMSCELEAVAKSSEWEDSTESPKHPIAGKPKDECLIRDFSGLLSNSKSLNQSQPSNDVKLQEYKETVDSKLSSLNIQIVPKLKPKDTTPFVFGTVESSLVRRFLNNGKMTQGEMEKIKKIISYKRMIQHSTAKTKSSAKKKRITEPVDDSDTCDSDVGQRPKGVDYSVQMQYNKSDKDGLPKIIFKRTKQSEDTKPVVVLERLEIDRVKEKFNVSVNGL
ncbi:uncharacterized protein LOC132706665 isoform X2 [Cylas formicarius]|nr:uncharacterized protein LOC132706665 isoform X2 [Cylas formicarius]